MNNPIAENARSASTLVGGIEGSASYSKDKFVDLVPVTLNSVISLKSDTNPSCFCLVV